MLNNNLNSADIQKNLWAAEVSYFAQNTDNLYDNTFTIKFFVRATNEENATKIATEIYENEFCVNSNVIAQQSIEDTNALNVYKITKVN
jgi:hypothetical protein